MGSLPASCNDRVQCVFGWMTGAPAGEDERGIWPGLVQLRFSMGARDFGWLAGTVARDIDIARLAELARHGVVSPSFLAARPHRRPSEIVNHLLMEGIARVGPGGTTRERWTALGARGDGAALALDCIARPQMDLTVRVRHAGAFFEETMRLAAEARPRVAAWFDALRKEVLRSRDVAVEMETRDLPLRYPRAGLGEVVARVDRAWREAGVPTGLLVSNLPGLVALRQEKRLARPPDGSAPARLRRRA